MKLNLYARPLGCLCTLASLAVLNAAQAASVTLYGVSKTQAYEQTSDTSVSPASDSYLFGAFAVAASANSVLAATVTGPNGQPQFLGANDAGTLLNFSQGFGSQSELDTAFGAGTYAFSLIDTSGFGSPINLTLGSDSFPSTTPQLTGVAALQTIDPTKPLVLSWNSFAGAGAQDFEQLVVTDDSGTTVFQTGLPGQANALGTTAQTVTIPANTLSSAGTYTATLTFAHVASADTTALPGATGLTIFSKQTTVNLTTAGGNSGGGGGIPTGTPPFLAFTNPLNNALNVAVTSPVTFTFTVPMAPVQKITWSANVDASSFTYSWSADGKTLTAAHKTDFPAGATITWALDPATFKDQTGTPLSTLLSPSGSFKTASGGGGGSTNPCNGGSTNSGLGSVTLFKSLSYVQTSAAAPVLSSDHAAVFETMILSPATNPVVSATVTIPGTGVTKPLTNIFGSTIGLFEEFSTQEAMDAAFPNGTYTYTINRTSGTVNISLTLASAGYPPTPQIQNFAAAQSFARTADFTMQWLPFTGATGNDGIFFSLDDIQGGEFHAPDPCIPRDLKNTDVSIVIPKNTFSGTGELDGSLSFSKSMSFDTNSIPGIGAFAGVSKQTTFKLGGSAPATQPPNLGGVSVQKDGSVHFQVTASVGATVTVEASNDLKTWVTVPAAPGLNGVLDVVDPGAVGQPHRFYKASAQ